MPIFIVVVFLSAFLLFQVQPVIARYILPWYGGSPAVWTTCLLFFQVGLLGGYAYAHGLVTFLRAKRKWQVGIHLTLLGIAFLLLPITPSDELKPDASVENPLGGIVTLLTFTVGFPYLLLSASGPLLQHWFSEVFPGRSPYRLYAISNFGSLLGLLTYPFFFEPLLNTHEQTTLWSAIFAVYGIFAICAAVVFWRLAGSEKPFASDTQEEGLVSRPNVLMWIAFSACGSILLLSLTSQMCQDVAVVPFLWVIPLSLYLLTFIIAFDHDRWYKRAVAFPLAAIAIGMAIWLMNRQHASVEWPLFWQITIYCSAIFFCCMICHGEVVRIKPCVRHLTGFYLSISFGGAIGGLFVSLIAPAWFDGYWELHVAFVLLSLLTSVQLWRFFQNRRTHPLFLTGSAIWIGGITAMVLSLHHHMRANKNHAIETKRGFYGVLQVVVGNADSEYEYRSLLHGRISHGRQYISKDYRVMPTNYYGLRSGVGAVFELLPKDFSNTGSMHVGVIGLGVGTIATYAQPRDRYRFYEINQQVETLARKHFTYLSDSQGEESVILGDARISLERELAAGENQQFDALFVDAFSGDSIPIHLLTSEAFALYFEHLKPGGILAIHISNLHLDLSDPVRNLAKKHGRSAFLVNHNPDESEHDCYRSSWILITKDIDFILALKSSNFLSVWDRETPLDIHWTDNYSNLFEVAF
jgi:hypothetical protein